MDEIGQNMQIFQEVLFLKLPTTEKQLIQLILHQLELGGWRKEKSMRLTDMIKEKGKLYDAKK